MNKFLTSIVARFILLTFMVTLVAVLASAQSISENPFLELTGDYCKTRPGVQCCQGRDDECSVPLYGTLCYCDEFCDRRRNPDCCSDFHVVCKRGPPPGNYTFPPKHCVQNGQKIPNGQKSTNNCNTCTCKNGKLHCSTKSCLVEDHLLGQLRDNAAALGWAATNYSKFLGKSLDEGLTKLGGTKTPHSQYLDMYPIILEYDMSLIPQNFDVRDKWPKTGRILDQGWCGASWAASVVSVAEDRFTIESQERENLPLSMQNLLSCNTQGGQEGCDGGRVEVAWGYLRHFGLVPDACYPYTSGMTQETGQCRIPRFSNLATLKCNVEIPLDRKDLYSTEPAYRIAGDEHDIMYEILNSGPVQSLMTIYEDLPYYRSGIYTVTSFINRSNKATHSVRIIGWGEEPSFYGPPVKYWLVTNSWGEWWGESGTFRIRRGTNEAGIEEFVLAVRAQLMN